MDDIKPCPFCGEKPEIKDQDVDGGNCYSYSYIYLSCCISSVTSRYYDAKKALHINSQVEVPRTWNSFIYRKDALESILNKWNKRT